MGSPGGTRHGQTVGPHSNSFAQSPHGMAFDLGSYGRGLDRRKPGGRAAQSGQIGGKGLDP